MPDNGVIRPSAIVIGAQKAGTTALYQYLCAHPDVAPPLAKEINFFMCPSLYERGLEFYHSHFPRADTFDGQKMTFEASPNYLLSSTAPARMYDYNPTMRLIAILRNPVRRAYSAWHMYRRFFRKKPNWYFDWMLTCDATIDFSAYVRRPASFGDSFLDDIRQECSAREKGVPIEAPFLRHGFYGEQLPAYFGAFPDEQIFVESNETLRECTAAVLSRLEAFLQISPNDWSKADLSPVFVGDYSDDVPPEARDLLRDLYRDSNETVYQLTGRDYGWN